MKFIVAFADSAFRSTEVCRVLLLDEGGVAPLMFRETLEGYACDLRVADSLVQARELLATYSPHVIFIDLTSSGREAGLDFCRAANATRAAGDGQPACFVLSGGTSGEDVRLARQAGADGYLLKPLSPMQLLALVDVATVWRLAGKGDSPGLWP